MTKADLQSGMRVFYRNGKFGIVMLNTKKGDLLVGNGNWGELSSYNDDLTAKWENGSDFDIMSVNDCLYSSLMADFKEHGRETWRREIEPEIEEITAEEAMKRLEEQSGKKVKIVR